MNMAALSIVYTVLLTSLAAQADSKLSGNGGPATVEEEAVIFGQAQKAFQSGQFADAARLLQKIVDRYPGSAGYIKSHQLLGQAYLALDKPRLAIPVLRYHIDSQKWNSEALRSRLSLAKAYRDVEQFQESLLVANEMVVSTHAKPALSTDLLLEGLLAKSWAYLGLKQDNNARLAVDAFFTKWKGIAQEEKLQLSQNEAHAYHLQTELKMRQCQQMLSQNKMSEGEIRSLIRERGTCLLEGLTLLHHSFLTGNQQWSQASSSAIDLGFEQYSKICLQPPSPEHQRSAVELKRYREELIEILGEDCQDIRSRASRLLQDWQKTLPPSLGSLAAQLSAKIAAL